MTLGGLPMLRVVAGYVRAATPGGQAVTRASLMGQELTLDSVHGLRVKRARIVAPDIESSNGFIHEIDTVLFPGIG